MKLFLKWSAIGLASIAALIGAHEGVVLLVDSHGWVRLNPADWAAWVGAIGTVGALFVAVWIWRRDHQIRNRDAYTQAIIAAGDKFHLLYGLIVQLHAARNITAAAAMTPDLRQFLTEGRNRVAAVKLWPSEEIAKLAPLPNDCARRIARAQFNITMFLNIGISDMHLMAASEWSSEQQAEFCRLKALDILYIIDDLKKANAVLKTAGATLNKPGETTLVTLMERLEHERLAAGTESPGWSRRALASLKSIGRKVMLGST